MRIDWDWIITVIGVTLVALFATYSCSSYHEKQLDFCLKQPLPACNKVLDGEYKE